MGIVDIIAKKRDGLVLSQAEIDTFVQGFSRGEIPDYQASAWAMAVLLRGMTVQETVDLTQAMVRSGVSLDLSDLGQHVVDKHSTGGVGDKTTLVVAPLIAAAGLPVAKMSGRGLGFSGGTLDKLESIPGMTTTLSLDRFMALVKEHGIVVAGQTVDLVPADGKLYALRDVTATVPSLPLIASSVMSKKIAGGAHAIVLDVKVGRGAFMETLEEARELAKMMIWIGEGVGRQVTAILSDMSQPLGLAVGNALEVQEAINTLQGHGPEDFWEHCVAVAAEMLLLGGVAPSAEAARAQLQTLLVGGQALAKFREWIAAQGATVDVVAHPEALPQAPVVMALPGRWSAYVERIDAREVGLTAVALGAGREFKGQEIDPAVGIVLRAKIGDRIQAGQPLLDVHARSAEDAQRALQRLEAAFAWSDLPVLSPPLVYDVLHSA